MKNAFIWFSLFGFFFAATAKSDYLSDLSNEDYKKLQEIARFLRQRLKEADAPEEMPRSDSSLQTEIESQSPSNELKPPFVYQFPTKSPEDGFPPFAAGPFDPRYYQDFETPLASTFGPQQSPEDTRQKRPNADSTKKPLEVDHSFVGKVHASNHYDTSAERDAYFAAIIAACSIASLIIVALIGFGCFRRAAAPTFVDSMLNSVKDYLGNLKRSLGSCGDEALQKNAKAAADVDYPAYGVTGPNKDVSPISADRRLAQSAQMYHYQHQKQQIIAMESVSTKDRRSSFSDAESEEDNEEGEYTVYECPGLAPTGEMEVKNPLFMDDQTPAPKSTNDFTEESQELPK